MVQIIDISKIIYCIDAINTKDTKYTHTKKRCFFLIYFLLYPFADKVQLKIMTARLQVVPGGESRNEREELGKPSFKKKV